MRRLSYIQATLIICVLLAPTFLTAQTPLTDVKQGEVQVTLNVPQIVSLNILTPYVVVVPGPEDYNRLLASFGTQSVYYWKCLFCGKEWVGWYPHPPGIDMNEVAYYDENDSEKGKTSANPLPKASFSSLFIPTSIPGGWWPYGNQHPTQSGNVPSLTNPLDSTKVGLIRVNLCEKQKNIQL